MAFIRKQKNREGKIYIYLVEGYRENGKVKQRMLKNYGILEELEKIEPNIYERLKREAKEGLLPEITEKQLELTLDLTKKIDNPDKNYSWLLLDELYNNLGISDVTDKYMKKNKKTKYDISKILKLLTYQRILSPKSKFATVKSQKELFGNWNITENQMDRALDKLNDLKKEIQLTIHNNIKKTIGRTATLVFYDVTNYYFETDLDDEDIADENNKVKEKGMRKRGPSKENRKNPIVQMGLFMDSNGVPITHMLFPGNETDPITYLPAIEEVKKQFGIERIVSVADKAMNSNKNIKEILEKKDGWIFSQKFRGQRGAPKDIQAFILDENSWQYNKERNFAKKSMIRERKIDKDTVVKEKVLVTWNQKYANREAIRRNGALEFAEGLRQPEKYRMSCKKGGKKYLELYVIDKKTGEMKPMTPFIDINYKLAEYDAQFDGVNVIVTSELELSEEEILENYQELYKIEDCFRITKTELKTRPVYVWTKEHIESHFLTCFLALVLLRILQYKTNWELSAKRIIDGLNSGKAEELTRGYWNVKANDNFKILNNILGIVWENKYVKYENLKKYAAGWYTTKLN